MFLHAAILQELCTNRSNAAEVARITWHLVKNSAMLFRDAHSSHEKAPQSLASRCGTPLADNEDDY
jgi:hypothetical protein